jgi:hypothetical protein
MPRQCNVILQLVYRQFLQGIKGKFMISFNRLGANAYQLAGRVKYATKTCVKMPSALEHAIAFYDLGFSTYCSAWIFLFIYLYSSIFNPYLLI